MTDASPMSTARLYAVRLFTDPSNCGRVAGRLEDVLSGRLHAFDDGATLLALLLRGQAEAYLESTTRP